MVTLKPVNNNHIEKDGMVLSKNYLDQNMEKFMHFLNNNSIANTIVLNAVILSLVNVASINISMYFLILLGVFSFESKAGSTWNYTLFTVISYFFFTLDFSLISVLATRYSLGTHAIDMKEIIFTQLCFTLYQLLINKTLLRMDLFIKSVLMFAGLVLYKSVLIDKSVDLNPVTRVFTQFNKQIKAVLLLATVVSFYFIDYSALCTLKTTSTLVTFILVGVFSYRVMKALTNSGTTQLSSLTSLIITSAIPSPTIVAIPLHIKILTFPTIASYSPILKFLLLNTTYMLIQFSYSFKTNSLGLLSDSLHMLLDCISLLLGYIAESRSNKISIKSSMDYSISGNGLVVGGFTNGVLLLAIAASVFMEGVSRIHNMVHGKTIRTGANKAERFKDNIELLIVSFMGLVVNLIGLFFFEDHSHGEHDKNEHEQDTKKHSCSDSNDNMRGVWLHLLADTMGSVFVVLSTSLHIWFDNLLFDPIFSIGLSILIFLTAVPLIRDCFAKLMFYNRVKVEKESHESEHSHTQTHSHSHSHSHSHTGEDGCRHDEEKKELLSNDFKKMLGQIEHLNGVKGYRQFRFWSSSRSGEHNTHGHSHGPSSDNESTQGFIHVLIDKKEDFGGRHYLKSKIDEIIGRFDIELWVQIEDVTEICWCRR